MSRSQATTLRKLIEASKGILTAETLSSVMHYYEHGEYEMAYEGLVLKLIRSGNIRRDLTFWSGRIWR